jgi:hypothetical protein
MQKIRNPHPKKNQQEFVKIGNSITLMRHMARKPQDALPIVEVQGTFLFSIPL